MLVILMLISKSKVQIFQSYSTCVGAETFEICMRGTITQVLTSPPHFLLPEMHFLYLLSLTEKAESSSLGMNCDSCTLVFRLRSSVGTVLKSCSRWRQLQERDCLLQFLRHRPRQSCFSVQWLQQRGKWNIANKAGSHRTNIILTQM